jgi:hypothetical protein
MIMAEGMARIVAVHGIGQQGKGEETLQQLWLPALRDGLRRVGGPLPVDSDLVCAFYGDLFRPVGKALDYPFEAADVTEAWERDLLSAWWAEAASVDSDVPGPEETGKARTPYLVQRALTALSQSRYFVGLAERALIGDLKQVYAYLHNEQKRSEAQARVASCVTPATRILIGHSLGSVVAYEAVCAHPEWPVRTLITLGSPLGIRHLIFDRLRPAPRNGHGQWPGGIERWINVADRGDIVALTKSLRALFGERLEDHLVHNGATAHAVEPYLTAVETGRAVAAGLAG